MSDLKLNVVDVKDEIKAGLKFYDVNGKVYLGVKDGRNIVGVETGTTQLTKTMVVNYIKDRNEETLVVRQTSKLTDVSVYELTAEQEITLDTVLATYALAVKRSDQWLVNRVFTEYMGK